MIEGIRRGVREERGRGKEKKRKREERGRRKKRERDKRENRERKKVKMVQGGFITTTKTVLDFQNLPESS